MSQIVAVLCGWIYSESHLVEALQGLLDFGHCRVGDANFDLLVLSLSAQTVPHHSAGIAGKSQTDILVKNNREAQKSTKNSLNNTNVFLEESDQHKSIHSRVRCFGGLCRQQLCSSRQLFFNGGGGDTVWTDIWSLWWKLCFDPFSVCFRLVWGSWSNHTASHRGPCDRKDVMSYWDTAEKSWWTTKYPKEQSWG